MKILFNLALTILLACSTSTTSNQARDKWIYDYENILTEDEEREISILVTRHEKKTTNEIAIVTTSNFGSDSTMFDFSYNWANKNGIGKKDKNNGVVIAVSSQLRSIFIQNGKGTEKVLSDWQTKQIIDSILIPEFKKANYFQGIKKGTEAVIEHLEKPENMIK